MPVKKKNSSIINFVCVFNVTQLNFEKDLGC